jgi:hypothetical protein
MVEIPGFKLLYVIAGFAGGIVSLAFVRGLTRWQGVMAVLVGALVANYITPVIQHYLQMPAALENGAAFITGLCAMNIIPGILFMSKRWSQDPNIPPKP